REAVRGEARGVEGSFWWQALPNCEIAYSQSPIPTPAADGRIVYEAADFVARDLAERLVGPANRTYQRAAGLTGEALASARRRGDDAGYIMSLDRLPLDPCREMQVLVDNPGWVKPDAIVPCVDTRVHAIVRRAHSGITAEWDGGLLLTGDGK